MAFNRIWTTLRNRPLVWDTITTTGWSSAGKVVGFFIPFFIAAWFGLSDETDAFFFVYGLILFFSGIFTTVVENVIVPYIAEARVKNEDVGRFVGKIIVVSGIGLVALTGCLFLVMRPILSLITRFDPHTLNLVFRLLMETAPLILLLTWTSIIAGSLNAYQKFTFPAVSPGFRALVILIVIFAWKETMGVHAIPLGYVVGEFVRLMILTGVMIRLNLFKLSFSFKFSPKLKEFLRTASYQTIGMVALALNPIVDKVMASWLVEGSVSVLHYAERLYLIPVNFLTAGLMVTLLSHWSLMYYESGRGKLRAHVKKAVRVVGIITLPVLILFVVLHQPLVKLAFGRGVFDQTRLPQVGWAFVSYLLGVVPYLGGIIYFRAHLTLKNTKVLMYCGFYRCVLNIILNFFLMRVFSTSGIALSTSLTSVFFFWFLRRKFDVQEDMDVESDGS